MTKTDRNRCEWRNPAYNKQKRDSLSTVSLVREAGLEFQFDGIYGIFKTFIRTKCQFCIKYSNISNWYFYPYPVKGSGKGKNKGKNRLIAEQYNIFLH